MPDQLTQAEIAHLAAAIEAAADARRHGNLHADFWD
jgi:hypothetical protein